MLGYSSVTQKGQITIPVILRERFKLQTGDVVVFIEDETGIQIKPVTDIFALKGSIQNPKRMMNPKKMRANFIDYLSRRKNP